MQRFTIHHDFLSFIKMATLIGFCFGVALVPLIVLAGFGQVGFVIIPLALISSPIVGVIEGLLTGLIGYPVYSWLSRGIGFEAEGNVYIHEHKSALGSHS